jgi:hypothetical protein
VKRLVASYALAGALLLSTGAAASELSDFTSDGCSLFPDGMPVSNPELWCDCCLAHDLAYWHGGTAAERKQADLALRDCVYARTADKPLSELMYQGVRAGGHPVFPVWYRWGYGWSYGRRYAPLTESERLLVEQKTALYRQEHPHPSCVVSEDARRIQLK